MIWSHCIYQESHSTEWCMAACWVSFVRLLGESLAHARRSGRGSFSTWLLWHWYKDNCGEMAAKGILVGCLLIACWVAVSSYQLHASCKLTWYELNIWPRCMYRHVSLPRMRPSQTLTTLLRSFPPPPFLRTFTVDCDTVHKKITEQMRVWNTSAPCGSSEKCGYTVSYNISMRHNNIIAASLSQVCCLSRLFT